jgi:peptidylprolyl isomerase
MTKQYPAAPEMTIDPNKEYIATLRTVRGDVKIRLRPDLAPQHVNSFVFLSREGFYDGVTFHRVLPGFVAQAGDPTGSGSGGPGYTIPAEFSDPGVASFQRGTLGMARAQDPNSGGSQWFINYAATPALDGAYTIFGEVTEGMEVVDCITPRDPSQGGNLPPGDQIVTIEIAEA